MSSLLAAMVLIMIVTMEIAIMVMVPVMIVVNPAAISVPVAHKIMLSIVMRYNPPSSFVRRASPIAFMPFVVLSYGIPISFHPHELRIWPCGCNQNHADWGWRGNCNSDG